MEKDGVNKFENKEERELWERLVVSYATIPSADPITLVVKADVFLGNYRARRTAADMHTSVSPAPKELVESAEPPLTIDQARKKRNANK